MTDLVERLRAIDKDIVVRRFDPEMSFDGMTAHKAADRIEKLEAVIKDDALWLAAYHLWCAMKGCAPSSSDLIAARKILEGKDETIG